MTEISTSTDVTDQVPEVPGSGTTDRVALSPQASELLVQLTGMHGPLMFHQSGGCCDGSALPLPSSPPTPTTRRRTEGALTGFVP